jgi:hypothetical protein
VSLGALYDAGGYNAGFGLALPPTVVGAALARLRDTVAGVAADFGDSDATPKFWADRAPPSAAPPYARVSLVGETDSFESADGDNTAHCYSDGRLQLSVFAGGRSQAAALSRLAAACLQDADLAFADGVLMEFRLAESRSVPEPAPAPGEPAIYHRALTFHYKIMRAL